MVIGTERIKTFSFIEPEHPFYRQIRRFEEIWAERALLLGGINEEPAVEKTMIHSEIKGSFAPSRGWELSRFYHSFQYWDKSAPIGFHAVTLYYSVKTGEIEFFEFPKEPYLEGMVSYFEAKSARRKGPSLPIEILRYVPLRRLTFRLPASEGAVMPAVGKFKRRSRLKEAYDRLTAVAASLKGVPSSFSVAAPVGIDEAHALFYQEEKQGEDLSALLNKNNYRPLIHAVGGLHHDLHRLDVSTVPEWDLSVFLQTIESSIQLILFFQPERQVFLKNLRERLLKSVPSENRDDYTFCHGDFVCSQLLRGDGSWSVIDFDLAMRGDPYREIAMFIASLKYDVPFFHNAMTGSDSPGTGAATSQANLLFCEEAGDAYLNGYEERAKKRLDQKKLRWYRICSEIYYLALMFKKDRFDHPLFESVIGQIQERSE